MTNPLLRSSVMIAAVVSLILLASCARTARRAAPRRAPAALETIGAGPTLRYLVLGDSTAVGEGGTYEKGIAAATTRHLAAGRKVETRNLGVSGAQVSDVLREQLPRIGSFVPDVVLISAGANDVTHLTSGRSLRRDLEQIVERLVDLNCHVRIVVTGAPAMRTPPRIPRLLRGIAGWRTNVLNGAVRDVARRHDLTFAPIAEKTGPLFARDKTLFSADEFHPSDAGYATWIAVLNPALDRALAAQADHCPPATS